MAARNQLKRCQPRCDCGQDLIEHDFSSCEAEQRFSFLRRRDMDPRRELGMDQA